MSLYWEHGVLTTEPPGKPFFSFQIFLSYSTFLCDTKSVHSLAHSKSSESDTQSCPTLCDPMNYTVHGILQARILEWIAFPFSWGSSQPRDSNPGLPHWQADSLPAEPFLEPYT